MREAGLGDGLGDGFGAGFGSGLGSGLGAAFAAGLETSSIHRTNRRNIPFPATLDICYPTMPDDPNLLIFRGY